MKKLSVLLTTYHEAFVVEAVGSTSCSQLLTVCVSMGSSPIFMALIQDPLEFYDVVLHFSVHGGGLGLLRPVYHHWHLPVDSGSKRSTGSGLFSCHCPGYRDCIPRWPHPK